MSNSVCFVTTAQTPSAYPSGRAACDRGHAIRSMMSSSASKPRAETVTSSPGTKSCDDGGITTSVTNGAPSPSSVVHASRKSPKKDKNNSFFI